MAGSVDKAQSVKLSSKDWLALASLVFATRGPGR